MKKILLPLMMLSAIVMTNAQMAVTSIQNNQNELVVNDSISLKKDGEIQIFLPAGKDFVFVKQKKSVFSTKLLSGVADVVGSGAAAVGVGSGSVDVLRGATKVINAANSVKYGVDALDKIQELPISNDAKKIAGKKMQITEWTFTDDGYIISAILAKKKYEIYLQEAVMAGEVKL